MPQLIATGNGNCGVDTKIKVWVEDTEGKEAESVMKTSSFSLTSLVWLLCDRIKNLTDWSALVFCFLEHCTYWVLYHRNGLRDSFIATCNRLRGHPKLHPHSTPTKVSHSTATVPLTLRLFRAHFGQYHAIQWFATISRVRNNYFTAVTPYNYLRRNRCSCSWYGLNHTRYPKHYPTTFEGTKSWCLGSDLRSVIIRKCRRPSTQMKEVDICIWKFRTIHDIESMPDCHFCMPRRRRHRHQTRIVFLTL